MKRARHQQEICIIFSRYPRPGASKTRLIPHLGPEGAAGLQRRMTEAVAGQAACLGQVHVELAMAGATEDEMASWLGKQFPWQQQVGEDLGQRMDFAFGQAFKRGFQRVVIVGADCPELSTDMITQAFQELREKELVLGPTSDGGYYLVGLRRPAPALFAGISWGSDRVLVQTLAIARKQGLPPALLAKLSDVDLPDDLKKLPPSLRGELF
ncbi:MAG: TIGR04282 family arsenosugar biosynthesis glycosyltransferase [Thermodesulfobacteriota bacterium]